MSKAQEIREIIEEINSVRQEFVEKNEQIKTDWSRSDSYKADALAAAIEEAESRLAEIGEKAEAAILELAPLIESQRAFAYDDPKLLAAVQFIQANGAGIPETAWRQMIADFSGKPQELTYLSTLFEKNRVVDGAVAAKEAAQPFSFSAGLPQRLSDKIYYVTHADPLAHIDLSGFDSDLDALDRFEAAEQIG